MKPPPLRILRPTSAQEAVGLLAEAGEAGRPLAGGQSLVPLLNFRLAAPEVLVDLNPLGELAGLAWSPEGLRVGAMTRQRTLERDPEVHRHLGVLAAALAQVGHPVTRNRGTLGGSLAHADPAAELPLVAQALDASLEVLGPTGTRRLAASELGTGFLTTCLEPGELVTACWFPRLGPAEGAGFAEAAPRSGDFALAAACCRVRLDPAGQLAEAVVVLGALAPTIQPLPEATEVLLGERPEPAVLAEAAERAARSDRLDPPASLHASPAYRRQLAQLVTAQALDQAVQEAHRAWPFANGQPDQPPEAQPPEAQPPEAQHPEAGA